MVSSPSPGVNFLNELHSSPRTSDATRSGQLVYNCYHKHCVREKTKLLAGGTEGAQLKDASEFELVYGTTLSLFEGIKKCMNLNHDAIMLLWTRAGGSGRLAWAAPVAKAPPLGR